LLIHNAIALDEDGMRELDALGEVRWLVVPNGWHRLDAKVFKDRYPNAQVVCPAGSKSRVEEVVKVDVTYDAFSPCAALRIEHLAGTKDAEGALIVRSADGATVVVNDTIFNIDSMPGVFGFIYGKLMGNTGGAKVTTITKLFLLKNKGAFRSHLERLADEDGLQRLIMSHGAIIDEETPQRMVAIASKL